MKTRSRTVIIVIIVIILIIAAGYLVSAFIRQNQVSQIESRINELTFTGEVQKEQCAGGTSELCTFDIESDVETVIKDLEASGYTVDRSNPRGATLTGGDPELTIKLIGSGDTTRLEATTPEGGSAT